MSANLGKNHCGSPEHTLHRRAFLGNVLGAGAAVASMPALDLLSACDVVILHKGTEALDLLTEAELVERFDAPAATCRRSTPATTSPSC